MTLEQTETQAELDRLQHPLVEALNTAGVRVSSVWDLIDAPSETYLCAIPLLAGHLALPYPAHIREGIARALAIRASRTIWKQLLQAYLEEEDRFAMGVKWALHLALYAAFDYSVMNDVIGLAIDRRHGVNRTLFVVALSRLRDPRAHATVQALADDPDLASVVAVALGSKRPCRQKNAGSGPA